MGFFLKDQLPEKYISLIKGSITIVHFHFLISHIFLGFPNFFYSCLPTSILICFFNLNVHVLLPLIHSTLTIIWFYFAVCLFGRE